MAIYLSVQKKSHRITLLMFLQPELSGIHNDEMTNSRDDSTAEKARSESSSPLPIAGKQRLKRRFYTHALYKIWHRCYIDKNEFEQDRILLRQKDILILCNSKGQTPHSRMHVMPKEPTLPLSYGNALLVNKAQRKFLISLWRLTKNQDQYIKGVKDIEGSGEK